ncbi:PAS domain S-box protein, partial [Chloroflexota bacterium]
RADWNYEGRMLMPEGGVRWFQGISSPTQVGEELVFDGILLDIAERKQAEEELKQIQLDLEERVQKRTVDLAQANEKLQSEIAERQLLEQELILKNIVFETSIAANSTADNDGVINHVNPAFLKMWGYETKEEAIGHPILHFFQDPDDAVPVMEAFNESGRWEGEFVAKKKDGSTYISRGHATVIQDEEGHQIGYYSTNIDVTEQKRAEAEIKELNFTLEQRVRERTEQLTATNERLRAEISERKQAEEALRESEERLRSTLASMDDLVFVFDRDGVFSDYHQPPDRADLYVPPEAFLGRSYRDVMPQHVVELVDVTIDRVKASGEVQQLDYDLDYPSGKRWYSASLSPRTDAEGQSSGVTVVSRDITERKRAEEELKRHRDHLEDLVKERTAALAAAKEQAEAANRAKSAFLTNMSHELRTPLNAILGFTQLMERDATFPIKQRENLKIIGRSGEHLLELINDVLELSKIEAGRATFTETDFDLYQLLATLESMFGIRAQNKGLQLHFERAPDVPQYIRTDERKLHQVLINLLNNAVKFTEVGGVTLRVRLGDDENLQSLIPNLSEPEPKRSRASASKSLHKKQEFHRLGPNLHFEVEDTGVGIAPEEMDRLFEAFTQTASGQEVLEGTGLGLPLSQRFVQLMGGDITVESPPSMPPIGGEVKGGAGSLFRFDIQVALPADVSEIEKYKAKIQERVVGLVPGQRAADGAPYRIMVVEDIEASRVLLVQLLTAVGFEVREAVNGQEAAAVWEAWKPHLIWMDMRMPVMDGYEATQRIKSQAQAQVGSWPVPVVIALTAHAFEEERVAILAAGCDDFVRKPFRETEIFDKMAQHLGLRYIYQDLVPSAEPDSATQTQAGLTPADLADLPADWVAELRHAAARGRAKHITGLIEKIRPDHARVAEVLAVWGHEFRFDRIMALTEPLVDQGE